MLGPGKHIIAESADMIQSPIDCVSYKGIFRVMLSGREQFRPHLVVGIVIDFKPGSKIFIAGKENDATGNNKQKQRFDGP